MRRQGGEALAPDAAGKRPGRSTFRGERQDFYTSRGDIRCGGSSRHRRLAESAGASGQEELPVHGDWRLFATYDSSSSPVAGLRELGGSFARADRGGDLSITHTPRTYVTILVYG